MIHDFKPPNFFSSIKLFSSLFQTHTSVLKLNTDKSSFLTALSVPQICSTHSLLHSYDRISIFSNFSVKNKQTEKSVTYPWILSQSTFNGSGNSVHSTSKINPESESFPSCSPQIRVLFYGLDDYLSNQLCCFHTCPHSHSALNTKATAILFNPKLDMVHYSPQILPLASHFFLSRS